MERTGEVNLQLFTNDQLDNNKTPLAYATEYKHPEIAKLLRDHGAVE